MPLLGSVGKGGAVTSPKKILAAAGGAAASGYEVANSIRMGVDTQTDFTPALGDTKTWTVSVWVKRAALGLQQIIWSAGNWNGDYSAIHFTATDTIIFEDYVSANFSYRITTTAVFRDPHAWYHIVLKYDSTPATPDNTDCALYVNGVQITSLQ